MWWRRRTGDATRNKRAMGRIVRDGREPGLLAYEAGMPIGWVSVAPRQEFGQLISWRTYRPDDEDDGVWSIVCFNVHANAKRRGVKTALLEAALDHAFRRGARALEAYPGEPMDYMGVREVYERLGFRPLRTAGKRTVVRLAPDT
jgi:GNAT superfamily N-acetyltransferase